jgi:NAD(P)-dependent dehydrogenase (short-subunit alcohol dehydrogenase family)
VNKMLAVLGGCGGIGRQLVNDAALAGWEPVVLDLPRSIKQHPTEMRTIGVDATDPSSLRDGADALGNIAGFVNLCGYAGAAQPVMDQGADDWNDLIGGNLGVAFNGAQAFAPRILQGGAMVMTGSGLGHFARPGYNAYAVSKAGIAALTRQLALELAPDIRVNCVAPSAVDTAFLRGGTGRSDENQAERLDRETYGANIPLGRIAQPKDVSGPILFLLSDSAAYITGQVIHINGGAFMP